jgi:hypothetical protein
MEICGVSRGRYIKPVPADQIKWVDDDDNPTTPPVKYGCEHPKHWICQDGKNTCTSFQDYRIRKDIHKKRIIKNQLNLF